MINYVNKSVIADAFCHCIQTKTSWHWIVSNHSVTDVNWAISRQEILIIRATVKRKMLLSVVITLRPEFFPGNWCFIVVLQITHIVWMLSRHFDIKRIIQFKFFKHIRLAVVLTITCCYVRVCTVSSNVAAWITAIHCAFCLVLLCNLQEKI